MTPPFSKILPDLMPDGALRDFYITDFTDSDWSKFLELAASFQGRASIKWGERAIEMPSSFAAIRDLQKDDGVLLSLQVGENLLNCHFFEEDELELDFDPADCHSEKNWEELYQFLESLVRTMGRKGNVTHENEPDRVIVEIDP